ncbi:MAG: major capsid protein [Nitrospira sp.]|nr:major capsid protein [Nitrospira sp.]MDH4371044.1 major capsid protein [Nitrospira sp.]MDH5498656.1 major capsid protein [Nitrospira sp.]
MRKSWQGLSVAVLGTLVGAQTALAQGFPVDTASTTTISNVKADIVAWGVVFIGVALTIYAYKRVKSLVR